METIINNKLIRSFDPCYDPSEIGIPDSESLEIKDWIVKYRNQVTNKEDVIWLLCRKEFMSDRDMRLFAVWCAREVFKLIKLPDARSVIACNVAERYANGEATREELSAARLAADSAAYSAAHSAAHFAAHSAAYSAARFAADFAARSAAYSAAYSAARSDAYSAQIDQLMTYFK